METVGPCIRAVAIVLFFGLPFLGLGGYFWLWRRMQLARVPEPPLLPLFLVFASYGILLELLVTALGDLPWSGAHSLGLFATVFLLSWALPFWGGAISETNKLSAYHRLANRLLMLFPLALMTAGAFVLVLWGLSLD